MLVELVESTPVEAKVSVTVPKLVRLRQLKVAVPLVAFTEVVPCKLPALAVAVTEAVEFETVLPYASKTTMTGCCAKATPATAVVEGCVTIPSCVAAANDGENVGAVPPAAAAVSVPSSAA